MPVMCDRAKNTNIAKGDHIYQTSFTPNDDGFINQLPSENPDRDPYMGIDTPRDEFYTINMNCCYIHSINQYFMLLMINISHQRVKKKDLFG